MAQENLNPFEIAQRLYPHATPEALSAMTRLALLFAAPKVPPVPEKVTVAPLNGIVRDFKINDTIGTDAN